VLVRCGLPAAGVALLGSAVALTLAYREALRPVLDRSTATLAGLAHAASNFLRQ
jgi:hypothetical protein